MGRPEFFIASILIFTAGVMLPFLINYNMDMTEGANASNPQQYLNAGIPGNLNTVDNSVDMYQLAWQIFKNNIFIGILLSLGGFYSFGLLTVGLLMWNGMLFGTLLKLALFINFPTSEILKTILIHGPLEIFAVCCFSSQGLAGMDRLRNSNRKSEQRPTASTLLLPVSILFAAAVLESFAIIFLN